MPTPFPPNGPQVQAALQKMPTPQLQQYAAAQPPQPTGQVAPGPGGPAGLELAFRNAGQQAAGRERAMQNNPQESPTVFQQKDREIAQQQQQLAAMQQQMQQKEKQLGVLGALMAKKAQDMQARESMGVATLPIRPDMFTAMDGGIVFSNGGGVQKFDGTELIDPAKLEDPLGRFGGLMPNIPVPSALLATQPAGTTRLGGIASRLKSDLLKAIEPSDEEKQRAAQLIKLTQAKIETLKNSEMSAEDKTRLINDEVRRLENILGEYTTGRAARTEKARAAIEGEAPTFQDRIGRGLGALAGADFNKLRIGEAFARMGAGARTADEAYAQRQREAAKFQADSEEKFAQADMLAKMGFTEKARQLAAQAQTEKLALAKFKTETIGAEQAGLTALQTQDEKHRANILDMLSKVATVGVQEEDVQRKTASDAATQRLEQQKFDAAPERKAAELRLIAALERDTNAARIRAEGAAGGRTDLQIRAGVFYNVLKEENDKLPQGEQKTDAQLRNQAYILAGNELHEARRTSAQANMLRALVFASDTKQEALRKVEYLGLSEEEKAKFRKEIDERYPTSGTASPATASPATSSPASSGAKLNPPPGVTRYLQRNSPPVPDGFVLDQPRK